jgi:hypothetical protein
MLYLTRLISFLDSKLCKRNHKSHWGCALFALVLFTAILAVPAQSQTALTLELTTSSASLSPGGTIVFTGVITNTTGSDLQSTDLFLNFSGFDPNALTLNQILGSTAFDLPNFTFSPTVDLFSVAIAGNAPPGIYSFTVQLEDVNNDLSNSETVNVNVNTSTTPEPGTFLLFGCGLVPIFLLAFRQLFAR